MRTAYSSCAVELTDIDRDEKMLRHPDYTYVSSRGEGISASSLLQY